jgi:hypothetical protein
VLPSLKSFPLYTPYPSCFKEAHAFQNIIIFPIILLFMLLVGRGSGTGFAMGLIVGLLFIGLMVGLSVGLIVAGLMVGLSVGLIVTGLMVGLSVGLIVKGLMVGLSVGLLVTGLMVGLSVGLIVGLSVGLIVGRIVGLDVGLMVGLQTQPSDSATLRTVAHSPFAKYANAARLAYVKHVGWLVASEEPSKSVFPITFERMRFTSRDGSNFSRLQQCSETDNGCRFASI